MATIYKYSILITFAHPNPNLAVLSPMSVGYNPTKADTFKFNKKVYKAKTNKKGIATIKLKKSVIQKLKAGKKYKITITYNAEDGGYVSVNSIKKSIKIQ